MRTIVVIALYVNHYFTYGETERERERERERVFSVFHTSDQSLRNILSRFTPATIITHIAPARAIRCGR